MSLFAADVLVIAIGISSKPTLIVAVIVSGVFIGINNTVTTQAVMTVAPVERPVASAAYGFIRFIGAGLAPYAAGRMAASFGVHVPFPGSRGTPSATPPQREETGIRHAGKTGTACAERRLRAMGPLKATDPRRKGPEEHDAE